METIKLTVEIVAGGAVVALCLLGALLGGCFFCAGGDC